MITVLLFLSFVGLTTYLLITKRIGSAAFSSLLIATMLFSIAVCGINRLEKLDLKNLTVTLGKMDAIRADVYAKQKSVEKLSNQFFKTSSQIISKLGYWDGDYSIEELIDFRNEAKDILTDSNADRARVKELLFPIEERILRDSRGEIVKKIDEVVSEHSAKGTLDVPFEQIKNETHKLVDNDNYEGLLGYLNTHNLADAKVASLIQRRKVIKSQLMR